MQRKILNIQKGQENIVQSQQEKTQKQTKQQLKNYFLYVQSIFIKLHKISIFAQPLQYLTYLKAKREQIQPYNLQINNKIVLFIDIDETLIHTISFKQIEQKICQQQYITIQFQQASNKNKFAFIPRYYCLQFLQKMALLYDLYLFTASQKFYAQKIFTYLNSKTKNSLKGIFTRQYCIQVIPKLYIKDPRIFSTLSQEKFLIIDNTIANFYPILDNGIPIASFYGKQDQQLMHLCKFLEILYKYDNKRSMIRSKFLLRDIDNALKN